MVGTINAAGPMVPFETADSEVEPVLDVAAWHADARWALRIWAEGGFDSDKGDYAAVYDEQVLEYGSDPNELRRKWSVTKSVPFQRIFVKYVGVEEFA